MAIGEHTPTAVRGQRPARHRRPAAAEPGRLAVLWFSVAAAAALLGGWFAARLGDSDLRTAAVVDPGRRGCRSVLPIGRFAAHRMVAAPAFALAAAYAAAWDPAPNDCRP